MTSDVCLSNATSYHYHYHIGTGLRPGYVNEQGQIAEMGRGLHDPAKSTGILFAELVFPQEDQVDPAAGPVRMQFKASSRTVSRSPCKAWDGFQGQCCR